MRALFLIYALAAAGPSHLGIGAPARAPSQCENIHMAADNARCDKEVCHLEGGASLMCDAMLLWGDRIDLYLDPNQQFDGARAEGNVLLVEGLSVVRCQAIELLHDRVQGRIDAATIEIRKGQPAPLPDPKGVPEGRNQAVLHGDIRRLDRGSLVVDHGDLTLCDCGEGAPPAWRVDASSIDITLGQRATIWWPQVHLHLWPDTLVPITPPLLPLSLPLTKRAMGFLPPAYTFFSSPWPTLDLPFFIPLGESWDLTLTPGLRMDWRGPNQGGLHTLGAPRLAARVRYAPRAGTFGLLKIQLTHDGAHGMAAAALANVQAFDPGFLQNPINAEQIAQRYALVNRVSLDWVHQGELRPRLELLTDVHWVSDDLFTQDFLIAPEQRVATYLPSRAQLIWRDPLLPAIAAVDAILRLDSAKVFQDARVPNLSNVDGAERTTLHRGPYLDVALMPVPLGLGLTGDAQLSFVRYGNWTGAAPENPNDVQQIVAGLAAGVGSNRRVGPVELTARAGLDGLFVDTQNAAALLDAAPLLSADATVRLGRRLGHMLHVVAPRLSYRGMPAVWADASAAYDAQRPALDERLVRRVSEQGMVVLQQSLWRTDAPSGMPVLALDIAQPWDLRTGALLQPWGQLNWNLAHVGTASLWTSVDPQKFHSEPVREIGVRWALPAGPVVLNTEYTRLAPDADRFTRSVYELAAPRLPLSPLAQEQSEGDWAHMLRGTASLRYKELLAVSYTTAYQLPRPGHESDPAYRDPSCNNVDGTGSNKCFTQHVVSVNYTSPCECWGVSTMVSVIPQDLQHPRFQINLTIANYSMGTSAAP